MRRHRNGVLTALVVLVPACQPDLRPPAGWDGPAGAERPAPTLVLEPAAALDQAPPVLRIHITALGPEADGAWFVLARGELRAAHLGQLARGEISRALEERLVPTLQLATADGGVVLAPTVPLELGQSYAVGSGSPRFAASLTVRSDDDLPLLVRAWPPADEAASPTAAVWCGAEPRPLAQEPIELAPGGARGSLRTGALTDEQGHRCIRFEPEDPPAPVQASPGGLPPPLAFAGTPAAARLDPRPLEQQQPTAPEGVPIPCAAGAIPFGPGCAAVADDRALLTPPEQPLLWSVQAGELDRVFTTVAGEPLWIHPLPVNRALQIVLWTSDAAGRRSATTVRTHTGMAVPHLIINEVMANPIGPEPTQEWVELLNDGLAPAELDGYELVDAGGHTPLPSAVLAPGRFALVVNDDYDPDDEFDEGPADGTVLLPVPSLGKGGLSNEGEPLMLRNADGQTVSRFPAEPKPHSGESVLRVAPLAPDLAPGSFVRSDGPPTPGAPNLLPEG